MASSSPWSECPSPSSTAGTATGSTGPEWPHRSMSRPVESDCVKTRGPFASIPVNPIATGTRARLRYCVRPPMNAAGYRRLQSGNHAYTQFDVSWQPGSLTATTTLAAAAAASHPHPVGLYALDDRLHNGSYPDLPGWVHGVTLRIQRDVQPTDSSVLTGL